MECSIFRLDDRVYHKARIDAPGALHHIMCRGIERGLIFLDDTDRDHFVERLAALLSSTSTSCFARAPIPNHFHLLVRTGCVPVSTVMRRLPTSYAVHFNRRHHRSGHLFRNRYKSILCRQDPYLPELVRYIHLNPLRAGIVSGLSELDRYHTAGTVGWQGLSTMGGRTRNRCGSFLPRTSRRLAPGIAILCKAGYPRGRGRS